MNEWVISAPWWFGKLMVTVTYVSVINLSFIKTQKKIQKTQKKSFNIWFIKLLQYFLHFYIAWFVCHPFIIMKLWNNLVTEDNCDMMMCWGRLYLYAFFNDSAALHLLGFSPFNLLPLSSAFSLFLLLFLCCTVSPHRSDTSTDLTLC